MKSTNYGIAEDGCCLGCEAMQSGRYLRGVLQEPVVSICRVGKNGPDTMVLACQAAWLHVLED